MDPLSTLFDHFLRERRYLENVTPKTVVWYETAFRALTRAVPLWGRTTCTSHCCTTLSSDCVNASRA